jgi:hypothetical protein
MTILPFKPAFQIARVEENKRWLIEELWADQAVGLIGGEPKLGKSFLALNIAVSIASGALCLRRFKPAQTGRVLLFAAEDSLHIVRQRLEGICLASNIQLHNLDIQVITVPTLRLDVAADRNRLKDTVKHLRPKLLLLDPFVRLHARDENSSSDVAPILGYLRDLQRHYQLAVILVHHARKGANNIRAGQALRGTSELHAWGDSNMYLRRYGNDLTLTVEHRAAAPIPDIPVAIQGHNNQLSLMVIESKPASTQEKKTSAFDRVVNVLKRTNTPLPFSDLRKACHIRTERLSETLRELRKNGTIIKTRQGYQLQADGVSRFPFPKTLTSPGKGKAEITPTQS